MVAVSCVGVRHGVDARTVRGAVGPASLVQVQHAGELRARLVHDGRRLRSRAIRALTIVRGAEHCCAPVLGSQDFGGGLRLLVRQRARGEQVGHDGGRDVLERRLRRAGLEAVLRDVEIEHQLPRRRVGGWCVDG